MKINKKIKKDSSIELEVILSWEDIKEDFNSAKKKVSKEIKVSGFRKGKIPDNILMTQYLPNIEYAFVQDYYLDNIEVAIEAYNQFSSYDLPYAEAVTSKNRVIELEELLIMEKQRLEQKINYQKAVNLFNNDLSIDSVVVFFV